ncbi:sulfur carrier protein ThiS [Noviherbaspirillum sp. Root189]|uniref:sulfur carrier protein ThiS n=1 Tax=Noviherbaspirillum sp. Root189 TaxID=1736487 RepID=UPI00070B158D|nr:MoaD/ThiS family protein [Noviherbaspirillum sp. Root189]KRB93793.1 molybdopterin synthase sulfur carrier subunit [Noviherbaspirillum sp. Root189]
MKVIFKLFASLTDYLPPERKYNAIELEVASDTTLGELITRFNMPPKLVHLVLINGVYVEPADRALRQLVDGDVVAIWPPVAGG